MWADAYSPARVNSDIGNHQTVPENTAPPTDRRQQGDVLHVNNPLAHFEIVSLDARTTARWYLDLLDWRVDANNPYGYPVITSGSPVSGGFATSTASGTVLYFQSQDLHHQLGQAEAAGARAETSVAEIDGVRFARFVDVCGNRTGIWQSDSAIVDPQPALRNPVTAFEMAGDQLLLGAFYRSVFGWEMDVATGAVIGPDGSIWGRLLESGRSHVSVVVEVERIDDFEARNWIQLGDGGEKEMWPDGREQRRHRDPNSNHFSVVQQHH